MIGGALPASVTSACVEGLCSALLERRGSDGCQLSRAGTSKPDSCLVRARSFPV